MAAENLVWPVKVTSCSSGGSDGDHSRLVFEEVVLLAKFRHRLTYANVMASVAVFIALGGSSYAVVKFGSANIINNSIRSEDIGTGQVHSSDILNNDVQGTDVRDGTIKSADVGDGSLLAKDFALGQLPTGPQGAAGHPGPPGTGNPGPPGPPGPTASQSAFNTQGVDLKDPNAHVVLDLASINGPPSTDHQITTTFTSRIIASGQISINYQATAESQMNCTPKISDGTGPTSGLLAMGLGSGTSLFLQPNVNNANNMSRTALPIAGSAVKPPGTYNVQIECDQAGGALSGTDSFIGGHLDVFAAAS